MTKKDKILNLLNNQEWTDTGGDCRIKIITYDMFYNAGLNMTIELGETYCDVIYARMIIQKLGHRVLIGRNFHIYENKLLPKTDNKL